MKSKSKYLIFLLITFSSQNLSLYGQSKMFEYKISTEYSCSDCKDTNKYYDSLYCAWCDMYESEMALEKVYNSCPFEHRSKLDSFLKTNSLDSLEMNIHLKVKKTMEDQTDKLITDQDKGLFYYSYRSIYLDAIRIQIDDFIASLKNEN